MTLDYYDLKDVLYSIDSTIWLESANRLLSIMGCPINNSKKIELWSVNDFLYHDPSIIKNLTYTDKLELDHIITLSKVHLTSGSKINCFAIEINTTYKNRTELAAEITIILSKVLSDPSILIFKNDKDIVFTGTYMNVEKSYLEIFISEWFQYFMLPEKYNQLLEIDLYGDYPDYLYSIERPYQKLRGSKDYLSYYYGLIKDDYDYIDRKTTYEFVRDYYRDIYGYDYYEGFIIYDYEWQVDDDLEWTMLEIEIESYSEEDDEDSQFEKYDEDDYSEDYDNDIFNDEIEIDKSTIDDNPENMLKTIRQKRAQVST